jgi:hypothetical protein
MATRTTVRLMFLTVVAAGLVWAGTAVAECARNLGERSPQQVLADHRAALAAEDWDAARCNFHPDATMIGDNGVGEGVAAIIAEFQALATFFGGVVPTVYSQIVVSILDSDRYMVRTLSFIDTVCVDIPDGTETYVIRRGRIISLTTHGFFVFSC